MMSRKRTFSKRSKHASDKTTNQGEMEWLTKDAMALDFGYCMGMVQVSVELGVDPTSQANLQPLIRRVTSLRDGLELSSAFDPKSNIEAIKEEVERSCSPRRYLLFLVGLLLGDLGNPRRPVRTLKEIETLQGLMIDLGISESVLSPLSKAFSHSPPPSEHFNAALVKMHTDLLRVINCMT
jgi:hypothetical protein